MWIERSLTSRESCLFCSVGLASPRPFVQNGAKCQIGLFIHLSTSEPPWLHPLAFCFCFMFDEITPTSSCWPKCGPFYFSLPPQHNFTQTGLFVSFKPIQLIWGRLIPVMFAWPTKLFNSFFSGQINSQAMYKFQKAEKCVLWKHTFLSFPQLNWLYFSYKSSFCYRLVCH